MKLHEFTDALRAAGVRRVTFGTITRVAVGDGEPLGITEIEFEPAHDTIPAPALEPEVEPESKAAGICAYAGCQEQAGFHFAPHLCEKHGLSQLGVKT